MTSKKKNPKANRRITIYTMVMIILIIGIILTAPNYILQVFDKFQEKQQLQTKIEELEKDEKKLSREVAQLNDAEYIARIARQKYLFSKDGEMIIKVDNKEQPKTENQRRELFDFKIDNRVISGGILTILLIIIFVKTKKRKRKTRRK